jgi:hypothetical protein
VALAATTAVTKLLGRIALEEGVIIKGEPMDNNTRWVFDVETKDGKPVVIQLLEPRNGDPLPVELLSFSLGHMSAAASQAEAWGEPREKDGQLVIHTKATEEVATLRVFIDVMGSAHR